MVEVWFQDEAWLGQQGTLTTSWARRGSRPTATKQTEYEWVCLYGAVCPATGESVGMVGGFVGVEWMNQHLAWISEHVRSTPGGEFVQVVLVLDRAGWHTSPNVEWPSNITPLFLPPHSPELNLVERLWHWLRSHSLSNRVYRDTAHLYAAARVARNAVNNAKTYNAKTYEGTFEPLLAPHFSSCGRIEHAVIAGLHRDPEGEPRVRVPTVVIVGRPPD
ncbi:MAG: IS630 family transposase [Phycisphaerales bacterium]